MCSYLPLKEARGGGGSQWFAFAVTGAYAAVLAALLFHHEMWADEVQAWLLTRDSDGVADLLANLRHEGHPPLWHLLLMPLARITTHPAAMQVAHWCICVGAVYIIVRHAPFTRWQRALLPFGYYPLFEYGAVARNYALGLLLVVAACALLPRWRLRSWRLGAILLLMSLTSAHACILVLGLVAGLAVDWALAQEAAGRPLRDVAKWDWAPLGGLALALLGVVLFVLAVQPAETAPHHGWRWRVDAALLLASAATAMNAFVPPMDFPRFWLHAGEVAVPNPALGLLFLPALLLIAAAHVRRMPALVAYVVCVAGLVAFGYLKVLGHARHHGFFLIALLLLCWGRSALGCAVAESPRLRPVRRAAGVLLTLWLASHAAAGVRAAVEDFRRPFSNAQAAAAFLDDRGLADVPMLGSHQAVVNGVVGHLRRERPVRYVQGNRDGTFARPGPLPLPTDAAVLAAAREIAATRQGPVLIVDVHEPLAAPVPPGARLNHLASFTGAIVGRDLHVYRYHPPATNGEP